MKKKLIATLTALTLVLGLTSCATETKDQGVTTKTPVVETFAAEYEMKGTTSAGKPKNDTFIFEGTTEDGVITELNFDIIRNKGTEGEYSKKDIMGYQMNVSDVQIEKVGEDYKLTKLSIIRNKGTEGEYSKKDIMGYQMNVSDVQIEKVGEDYKLTKLSAAGYDDAFEGGQYMVTASADVITDTTTFKDLTFINLATQAELEFDKAIAAYKYVAVEAGIEDLNEETLVKDIISKHELYKDGSFVEGVNRISFAGYNGVRSYGEQIDAIATHILNEKMTLEEVYEMFKTVNQMDQPIAGSWL